MIRDLYDWVIITFWEYVISEIQSKRWVLCKPATASFDKNNLNIFERALLLSTFRGPCSSTKDIPTKATHPEEFI